MRNLFLINKLVSTEEQPLEQLRGWDYCGWELFDKTRSGHAALVKKLKEIVESKYNLKLDQLDEKEECIAWGRHGQPIYPHNPDIIINVGDKRDKPEDRIFIEYVNTPGRYRQNYLRDLRGMLALSAVVKRARGFVVATRDSIWNECYSPLSKKRAELVEPMSLRSLFLALDKEDYDYLVGKLPSDKQVNGLL